MSNNPTFTVYVGPMWGGKSTRLLLDLERSTIQRKRCVVFKPALDDRFSAEEIVSHTGRSHPAVAVNTGTDVLRILAELPDPPDVVFVDEAFMLTGIADVVIWLYRSGISVVVSSLDLSYAGKPFPEVAKMLPWATHVEKCPAVCAECGRDAYYTHKKQVSEEEIEVGGADLYSPRCFRHHVAIDSRPELTK